MVIQATRQIFLCFLDVKSLCVSGTREQSVQIQSIIQKSTVLLMNNPFILNVYDSTTHDKCFQKVNSAALRSWRSNKAVCFGLSAH